MSGRIMVGYDGSDQAKDALALGQQLAAQEDAHLLLAYVFRHELPSVAGWDEYERGVRAEAERELGNAMALVDRELRVETCAAAATSDVRGLLELATERHCDLIVVGSSHRAAVGRTLIGSVGERLLHGSPCPVAVAPGGYRDRAGELRVVAAAFDGSSESRAALAAAAGLAESVGATLRVLAVAETQLAAGGSVVASGYDPRQLEQEFREQLDQDVKTALEDLPAALRAKAEVISGSDPANLIASECEKGVDLLVTGSRGYGPVLVVLLGSVSAKLMRSAPCPVIAVPRAR